MGKDQRQVQQLGADQSPKLVLVMLTDVTSDDEGAQTSSTIINSSCA
jgi:hypothetical protein